MHLPEAVRLFIEQQANSVPFADLKRAAAALSEAYRSGASLASLRLPPAHRVAAYLVTRMPATYAAAFRVLEATLDGLGGSSVTTVLDAGAGTGAATLAARELFPGAAATLIEAEPSLLAAGRKVLPETEWRQGDLRRLSSFEPHDLVLASYTLGELPSEEAIRLAERLWAAARVAFVLIEPGTPRGFALVREIRARLIAAGARMAAPCPSAAECPMRDPDWCHFGARVERSRLHRRMKEGSLSYEDEKYSYVALAKGETNPVPARILRRPAQQPGLITLELCRAPETATLRIPHRDRERFRAARKAGWGDPWIGV